MKTFLPVHRTRAFAPPTHGVDTPSPRLCCGRVANRGRVRPASGEGGRNSRLPGVGVPRETCWPRNLEFPPDISPAPPFFTLLFSGRKVSLPPSLRPPGEGGECDVTTGGGGGQARGLRNVQLVIPVAGPPSPPSAAAGGCAATAPFSLSSGPAEGREPAAGGKGSARAQMGAPDEEMGAPALL